MRFRNCLGRIWSVSTLDRSSGATNPVWVQKGFMRAPLSEAPLPHVGEATRDRCGGRHHGTHQMRAPAPALSAFKVAVAGRGATLTRLKDIGIHSEAHRAARFTQIGRAS